MAIKLRDVNGWHEGVTCVPTMLCAISGRTPAEIAKVLRDVAKDCGASTPDTLQRNYNIKHWLRAIEVLGGSWGELYNLADRPADQRPSIDGFLASQDIFMFPDSLLIVFCDDQNSPENETHVFAVQNCELVDTYTRGKKNTLSPVPQGLHKLSGEICVAV